jgi:hypothetical protein
LVIRPLLSILCLLGTARALWAEPLDRREVPGRAKWVIHLDGDAARSSKVGQAVIGFLRANPASKQALAHAQDFFAMDLTADIRGITAYGEEFSPEACVLIVHGRLNHDRLTMLLHSAPHLQTSSRGGHEICAWTESDPNDPAKPPHESAGALVGDDLAVLGRTPTAVAAALDVIDGRSPQLSGADSPLAQAPGAGTILEAQACGLSSAAVLPAQSPVVRQCESGCLFVGEREGQAFVHAGLVAKTDEVASQVHALAAGAQAMVQLQSADNPDVTQLLAPVHVKVEGRAVRVDWQMPADKVLEIVESQLRQHLGVSWDAHSLGKEPPP